MANLCTSGTAPRVFTFLVMRAHAARERAFALCLFVAICPVAGQTIHPATVAFAFTAVSAHAAA